MDTTPASDTIDVGVFTGADGFAGGVTDGSVKTSLTSASRSVGAAAGSGAMSWPVLGSIVVGGPAGDVDSARSLGGLASRALLPAHAAHNNSRHDSHPSLGLTTGP